MKKLIIASTIATSVFLIGCGDKSEAEIAYEQKKELMLIQQQHEREMARIEAKKVAAENQVSHTYVENEYEAERNQSNSYTEPRVPSNSSYQPTQSYGETALPPQAQTDEGFGAGSMLLAGAAGMAVGYMVGEMLDNGMKSYTDETGKTHYVDSKTGKSVSKEQYETARKTSKVTKFKEKAKEVGTKAKEVGKTGLEKSKELGKKGVEKSKELGSKAKEVGKKGVEKSKQYGNNFKKRMQDQNVRKPHRAPSRPSRPSRRR